MGTRNLTIVKYQGEYKVAQYGQWDGYPEGQGATILEFLRKRGNIDRLKNQLKKVRFLDREGKDKEFIESYDRNAPEWSNEPDNRTAEQKRWFSTYITRNLGGKILEAIIHSLDKEILLANSLSFAGNSLMCEFAYVIDLDIDEFEVYQGFNHDPVKEGRFKSSDEALDKSDGYGPIVSLKSYPLSNLPTEKCFLKELGKLLAEEEENE